MLLTIVSSSFSTGNKWILESQEVTTCLESINLCFLNIFQSLIINALIVTFICLVDIINHVRVKIFMLVFKSFFFCKLYRDIVRLHTLVSWPCLL